jgi:hypothetical protein
MPGLQAGSFLKASNAPLPFKTVCNDMERRFLPRCSALVPIVWLSLVMPLAANATQIIPGGVEYTNDKIGSCKLA